MNSPRRLYRSPTRQRQAAETRARILATARVLLAEQGYAGATVEAIAQAAGVAVQTVFAVFGSKRGILAELLRLAQETPAAEELRARLRATDDPAAKVRLAVAIARCVYEQMAGGLELLRGARLVAPELAAVEGEIEARRRAGAGWLVDYVRGCGRLRAGLTPAAAADLLWVMTSPDVYRKLVHEQGWTGDAYELLLGNALVAALLAPGGTSGEAVS
jgi:TetR/AcrR family transcriptional regulator, regulator of cefoperazone and chloramphenicol sensitivity